MHLNHDLTTLVALFAIMNPISAIPIFLALTPDADSRERRRIAIQTGLATAITLVFAYFVGEFILDIFRIQMDGFRVAGALIIGAAAWSMIFGKAATAYGATKSSPAVIPLAIPKTAGPGAIAVVIALGEASQGWAKLEDVVIILLLAIVTVVILLGAQRIDTTMGETGMSIVTRIFGLLLLAISISSILTSLADFFPAWVG